MDGAQRQTGVPPPYNACTLVMSCCLTFDATFDVDTVQETCILWAQSVDRPDPWIALRNLWILTSRRNPWIAQGSCLRDLWILPNFAYTTNNYTMVIPRWRRHIIWIDW